MPHRLGCLLLTLLKSLLQVALLRMHASDLPASRVLLGIVIGLYVTVTALTALIPYDRNAPPLGETWAVSAVALLVYLAALRISGKGERSIQTLTALIGVDVVFASIDALLLAAVAFLNVPIDVVAVPSLFVLVWALLVYTRILADALGWPQFAALALVLMIQLGAVAVLYDGRTVGDDQSARATGIHASPGNSMVSSPGTPTHPGQRAS